MKNKLLKELYDCFYVPPELPAQKQEIEECHQALIEALEKPDLQNDRCNENQSLISFLHFLLFLTFLPHCLYHKSQA